MPFYRRAGDLPRKRHSQHRRPDGGLYAEELMGVEGFSSDSSLLYHRYLPTAIVKAEALHRAGPSASGVGVDPDAVAGLGAGGAGAGVVPGDSAELGAGGRGDELTPNHPLLPRHFRTHELPAGPDTLGGRHLLLANPDIRISYAVASSAGELYRNAIGDELVYVESGSARLETTFGALEVGAGDYVVIPTSTTHRFVPAGEEPLRALVAEASGHVRPPRRYLSSTGQFLEHAPYCERDLRSPLEPLVVDDGETAVVVRHRSGFTRYTYLHHPFDVVGWDGCLYPYVFSIHDFEPIVKRFHAPPPVHQTFEGPGFVVCSFCPRPFDFDPQAIAVPYNHANVDSDEVLFYAGGDFMSRKGAGIAKGSISLHPSGFIHGPQPGSVEAALGKSGTDELAVMIDTFRPLALGAAACFCEDGEYAWTWARGLGATDAEDAAHPGLTQ